MKLILGLIVFPKVGVLVREVVEIQNEFLKNFLFVVNTV
jgi:hypothetical protein